MEEQTHESTICIKRKIVDAEHSLHVKAHEGDVDRSMNGRVYHALLEAAYGVA